MDNSNKKNSLLIKKISGIGVFAALAYITTLVCQIIPKVDFLSLELKDAVISIASFVYGPLVAPLISLVVSFVEFFTISTTGFWGFIMNFVSSTVFSLTASLIYKFMKSYTGAIIGLGTSVIITTTVMLGLNPLIVPLYSGAPTEVVVAMIPTLLLPFNFAKALMNGAVSLLLYKPIITAMRTARLVLPSEYKTTFNKSSIITIIVRGVALLCAFGVLLWLWLR